MSKHMRATTSGSSDDDLRLVLLGNIGCGKTSTADTVLGQRSPISFSSSRSCQLRRGFSEGRNMTLVEAPRWYWNGDRVEDSVRKETEKAITLVTPGPHAVLLLVPINQFTEMEVRVPAELEELFGREVLDHTLVLLTCGDYLMGSTVENYIQKEHAGLREIIERCGKRYHVINNRQPQHREQVHALLEKVERMVQENGVFFLKTAEARELETRMREQKEELMENYSPQKEKERERVASKITSNTETCDRRASINTLDRKSGEERDEIEERIGAVQVSNGLRSSPALQQAHSEPHSDMNRTPSFSLAAGKP
ncbi:GTPase IMAP family member 9 [Xenentodon cancila]